MKYVDILKEVNKNENTGDEAWQYDENNRIKNYLNHIWYGYKNDDGTESYRLKHDCDAFYYKEVIKLSDNDSLFADSILSFWMPYQSRINLLGFGKYYKPDKKKWYAVTSENLKKYQDLINSKEENIITLNNKLKRFSELIYTKGNFIKLPQISDKYSGREMQSRGSTLCDEIDWTIHQCHNGGLYFKYFDYNEDKVDEWIRQEKLEMADKPFLSSRIYKTYYDMTDKEFDEYISKAIDLMEYRNEHYHPEEIINVN